jgi:hypothetical protein
MTLAHFETGLVDVDHVIVASHVEADDGGYMPGSPAPSASPTLEMAYGIHVAIRQPT